MGPLGWQETVAIFVLALLIFGPKKLPELGKTIGKAFTEFRRASTDLRSTFDREMRNLERESESLKEVTNKYQNDLYDQGSSYDYDSSYNYEEDSYGSHSYDSPAANPSTVSASASEGAESAASAAPETGAADTEDTAVSADDKVAAGHDSPDHDPKAGGPAGNAHAS